MVNLMRMYVYTHTEEFRSSTVNSNADNIIDQHNGMVFTF